MHSTLKTDVYAFLGLQKHNTHPGGGEHEVPGRVQHIAGAAYLAQRATKLCKLF